MTDPVQLPLPAKADIDKFVDDMLIDAMELRAVLHNEGDKNDIKERITCLKYLEEIVKTHFVLKKASTHDPDAAGSTVRKYASAFAKSATDIGKKRGRRKPAAADDGDTGESDSDLNEPDAAA